MIVKLLTEHHLEFLRLKGGCRGSSQSTLVKMSGNLMHWLIVLLFSVQLFPNCSFKIRIGTWEIRDIRLLFVPCSFLSLQYLSMRDCMGELEIIELF